MCLVEQTFHVPCGHWGENMNTDPCARAQGNTGLRKGCWDATVEGVRRLDTMCSSCRRVQQNKAENPHWNPLANISPEAWQHIRQRRTIGSRDHRPWLPQPEFRPLERRRSCSKNQIRVLRLILTGLVITF